MPNPCAPAGVTDPRALAAFEVRFDTATTQAKVPIPPHTTNDDEATYADKSGSYSKGLRQTGPGIVDPAAWASFKKALNSGLAADFANIIIGGTRTLNGPRGSYAFTLAGTDAGQFGDAPSVESEETVSIVPPAPAVASEAYGTELVELYWASLLRDVAFTDYAGNDIAKAAAKELSGMAAYQGPKGLGGKVTPDVLFRGAFPGETVGPYISQLLITPTMLGAQPIDQKYVTYRPHVDYMTTLPAWEDVQKGIEPSQQDQPASAPRHLHNGRGLAAFTHVDELFQSYFTAYLVLQTLKTPPNPGNPYIGSKTENGFGTFGGPDVAATLAEVAKIALNAVWYQKWLVHLRHRPESGGGLAELFRLGKAGTVGAQLNANVLNSKALAASFHKYKTNLLSQAFPEGSPYHPAYPTGHGTVGGACITVLKFFFKGAYEIPNPQVPSYDGLALMPYAFGPSDGKTKALTVNGELNKLGHNVSFGHGIHAGIHWRSDTDISLLLGEAIAIAFLKDKAATYKESFSIQLTRFDGGIATITNP